MGYRITEDHVRVRTTLTREWVWELVTRDGHVAAASPGYADRDACEADAHRQGLQVIGGRRAAQGRKKARTPGWRVYSTSAGLWKWEHIGYDGVVSSASELAFLTREECERDLARATAEHAGVASVH